MLITTFPRDEKYERKVSAIRYVQQLNLRPSFNYTDFINSKFNDEYLLMYFNKDEQKDIQHIIES